MSLRAILFDLDGTLIDQFDAIHKAFSKTIAFLGLKTPSFNEIKRAVGGGSEETMSKLIGPERAKEAVEMLRPIFEKEMLVGLKPLPHALTVLKEFNQAGIICGVLTNKFGPHARAACEHLNLSNLLKLVIGADDTNWKKPHPLVTKFALNALGATSSTCLYVGDSPYDFETAENAGMPCKLVSTGTHKKEELEEFAGPQNVFENLRDLKIAVIEEFDIGE